MNRRVLGTTEAYSTDDLTLVETIAAVEEWVVFRDEGARNRLVNKNLRRVRAIAFRLVKNVWPDVLNEIEQAGLLGLLEELDALETPTLRGWYRALNGATNAMRRELRALRGLGSRTEPDIEPDSQPDELAQEAARLREIAQEILAEAGRPDERCATILVLYSRGLTFEEIAQRLGTSVRTVRYDIWKLAKRLEARNGTA